MTYLPSSIREAYSMSNKAIKQALAPYVLYGLKGANREELISMWLERWGIKELAR